ncbi:MAG: hypothetical protein U0638_12585 [Phycisphaerales bacterium]
MSLSALAELIERLSTAKSPADLASIGEMLRFKGAPTVAFEALLMLGSVDSVLSMEHARDPLAADVVLAMANLSNFTRVTDSGLLVPEEPLAARKYGQLVAAGSEGTVELTLRRFLSVRWPSHEALGAVRLDSRATVAGACAAVMRLSWFSKMELPEFVHSFRIVSRLWQEGLERADRGPGSGIPFATWRLQLDDHTRCLAEFRDTLPSLS